LARLTASTSTMSNQDFKGIPRLVTPSSTRDLAEHLAPQRAQLDAELTRHGALLFRGFDVHDVDRFATVSEQLLERRLPYEYRSTSRSAIRPGLYTVTEYPAGVDIKLHCENAYQSTWPMRLVFWCKRPASSGGATPLADNTKVSSRLPPDLVSRFARRQIRYVRNYPSEVAPASSSGAAHGLDLSWQTAFQARERDDVERYCRERGIEVEWRPDGRLRTSQVLPAIRKHPRSGRPLWFNQAHIFHASNLGARGEAQVRELFNEADLPRNAYFGDGSEIPASDMEFVRSAYESELVEFAWHAGDVLLVDNMMVAHGRRPYTGEREVFIAMGNAPREA
jgi:alpha-ketoglutarate-dependent taurine dioxygenase